MRAHLVCLVWVWNPAMAAGAQDSNASTIEPAALVARDGTVVHTAEQWRNARRPEIRALFEQHVYGKMPVLPSPPAEPVCVTVRVDEGALDGTATCKEIAVALTDRVDGPTMDLLLFVPNRRRDGRRAPVFLGLNFYGNHAVVDDPAVRIPSGWVPQRGHGVVQHRATARGRGSAAERWPIARIVARGYAVATAYHGDVDPDFDDGFRNGVHPHVDGGRRDGESWGTIAAWAYGLHRAVDYLVTDPDVDVERIAVMGHSRNGKTALWAGATDERIALVVSNQSGCGGAALSRRRVGETVARINRAFPHWFCRNFRRFDDREDALPVDQHLLVALCAPRPVLVCSAVEDRWADPEGEFLALVGADPVYRLLGADGLREHEVAEHEVAEHARAEHALAEHAMPQPGRLIASTLGYHIRPGRHGVGPADWDVFCDFADAHWGRHR